MLTAIDCLRSGVCSRTKSFICTHRADNILFTSSVTQLHLLFDPTRTNLACPFLAALFPWLRLILALLAIRVAFVTDQD